MANPLRRSCCFALIGILFLQGCGAGQITTSLQLVIAAAEAAVTALGATGQLPASTVMQLDGYLSAVSKATSFAATELQSADSPAMKATKIIQQFAAIAAPIIPPGTPEAIVVVIQSVITAIANFLATIQPGKSTATAVPPKITLTSADHKELNRIHDRAEALLLKISK